MDALTGKCMQLFSKLFEVLCASLKTVHLTILTCHLRKNWLVKCFHYLIIERLRHFAVENQPGWKLYVQPIVGIKQRYLLVQDVYIFLPGFIPTLLSSNAIPCFNAPNTCCESDYKFACLIKNICTLTDENATSSEQKDSKLTL